MSRTLLGVLSALALFASAATAAVPVTGPLVTGDPEIKRIDTIAFAPDGVLLISDGATNRAQCAEVGRVLTRYAARGPVTFGGDMNRLGSCAPAGFWTRTDWAGGGIPGLQHVYGSRSLARPTARVVRADLTDHDFLAVDARPVG